VLVDDDQSPRNMGVNRGYGATPRPPSMFQQRMVHHAPASLGIQPNYGYPAQPSFNPGEVVSVNNQFSRDSPATPNSAHPLFSPMGQSPMGSPVSVAPYGSAYDAQGHYLNLNRQPSTGAAAYLSRQPSMRADLDTAPPEAHYVDLNRSSVSPFQAQQYAEISRRLNTSPPAPLPTPVVTAAIEEANEGDVVSPKTVNTGPLEVGQTVMPDQRLAANPSMNEHSLPESPFADPQVQTKQQQPGEAEGVMDNSINDGEGEYYAEEEFPQPPSPTFQKNRIDSTPPILPEIHIQNRAFSPVSMEFPIVPSSARPSPSPLSQSFNLPSPMPNAHFANSIPGTPLTPSSGGSKLNPGHNANQSSGMGNTHAYHQQSRTQRETNAQEHATTNKRPDTVYSMYDDEDAYGGI